MAARPVVHITARERDSEPRGPGAPREAFWNRLRQTSEQFSNLSASQLEGALKAQFGAHLRENLISHLRTAREATELRIPPEPWFEFERFMFRGPREPGSTEWAAYFDMLARLAEARHRAVESVPELATLQGKLAAAATVTFSVTNVRYGSLTFDLSLGSLGKIVTVFDNDFDSFRVFLEAFVPISFAESTDHGFAQSLDFEIVPAPGLEQQFATSEAATSPEKASAAGGPIPVQASRERAEWLWRLANGSLLVPLLISILIMWYGLKELGQISDRQMQYLQPILQHQLELLREDRLRLQGRSGADSGFVAPTPRLQQPRP